MGSSSRPLPVRAALAAVGLTSTIGQLVLLREMVAVFYGNELVFGLILAAWLAWVAVGAWVLGRRLPRPMTSEVFPDFGGLYRALATGLVVAAAALPAQVGLVRASPTLLGVTPGALVALGPLLLAILLCLAPLCLLLGWLFTVGARALAGEGGSIGGAYTVESLGAVAGGALFSLLLVRWLDPFQVALAVGATNLAVAWSLTRQRGQPRSGRVLLVLGAALLAITALPLGAWLHQATLGWQYTGLRFARDSLYGRIVVTGSGEQRVFFENGMLFFETQGAVAEEVAHLPLLAHPEPRRVLLIGGGVSGTLAEILHHPSVQEVHYVELDPVVVAAARSELPPLQAAVLNDPRVILAHIDGRLYVREVQEPFDVVILDLPEPATGQLNRFYTQEFFAEVRALLAPQGVFFLGLPWQENYPGPELQQLATSVYRTLSTEFAELTLLPSSELFLLASETNLPADPALWSARLAERGIPTRWVVLPYLEYLLAADRTGRAQHLLETTTGARLNRDLEPICYFYDLTVWLSRFSGTLSRLATSASLLRLGWLAVPLAALVVLLRFLPRKARRRSVIPATIALIGLAGMVMQVVILFAFQVVHGYVYGQVGLIITAFMAGLALGSALANRRHWPGDERRNRDPRRSPRVALLWIQAGLVLFAIGFPLMISLAPPAWTFLPWSLFSGGLTGLAFPLAVACLLPAGGPNLQTNPGPTADQIKGKVGHTAGLLYGADLVGGCLGAVTASVFLVPILGISQTCLAVAIIAVAGLAMQ